MKDNRINKHYRIVLIVLAGWFVFSISMFYTVRSYRSEFILLGFFLLSLIVTKFISQRMSLAKNADENQQKPHQLLSEKQIDKIVTLMKSKIQSSRRNYIKIIAKKSSNLDIRSSKFGGLPFINSIDEYPKNSEGRYLHLLAQFNLSDLPENQYLPNTGMIQFFIADTEDFGLGVHAKNIEEGKTNFNVRYISEDSLKKKPIIDFSFLPKKEQFPFLGEYSLSFENDYELEPIIVDQMSEYIPERVIKKLNIKEQLSLLNLFEDRLKLSKTIGHKIGGYGHYPQNSIYSDNNLVLFQMDSGNDILWGDVGTAHFFIRPEDLKTLNFKNVTYNWDCY